MEDLYFTDKTIDDYELSIYEIFWTLSEHNAYIARPFIYLSNKPGFVGYLDSLSTEKEPDKKEVVTTDIFLENLYCLTASSTQRKALLDYELRITTDFKLFRQEACEMAEIYTKFAKRFIKDQFSENSLFDNTSISRRQSILAKTTFDSKNVFWHVTEDNASYVRPFLKLADEKIGYLDNCEIGKLPQRKSILTCEELAELLDVFGSANQEKEKVIDLIYDRLTLPERLSQKMLARISQIYHETAMKYAKRAIVINDSFEKYNA